MAWEDTDDTNTPLIFERRIFVGGLSNECNEEILFDCFSKYGTIHNLQLIQHKHTTNNNDTNNDTNNDNNKPTLTSNPSLVEKRKRARKRIRPSFAFITFDSNDSAACAIEAESHKSSSSLPLPAATPPPYTIVKGAKPPNRQNQTKYKAKLTLFHLNERTKYKSLLRSCDTCNVILQVHTSHLDRLVDYLPSLRTLKMSVQVTGMTCSTTLDNISLVMVHSNHPLQLTDRLWTENPLLDRMALNKSYIVQPQVVRVVRQEGSNSLESLMDPLMQEFQNMQRRLVPVAVEVKVPVPIASKPIVLKIQAFPPKSLQKPLVSAIDTLLNRLERNQWEGTGGVEWSMSPKVEECTHMISCVMLHAGIQGFGGGVVGLGVDDDGDDEHEFDSALYMVGIAPISHKGTPPDLNSSLGSEKDEVCRAYYKLKEAFERYTLDCKEEVLNFENKVAFDCGML